MENHAALKIISYILICLFHIYNNMLYYINVNPLYVLLITQYKATSIYVRLLPEFKHINEGRKRN